MQGGGQIPGLGKVPGKTRRWSELASGGGAWTLHTGRGRWGHSAGSLLQEAFLAPQLAGTPLRPCLTDGFARSSLGKRTCPCGDGRWKPGVSFVSCAPWEKTPAPPVPGALPCPGPSLGGGGSGPHAGPGRGGALRSHRGEAAGARVGGRPGRSRSAVPRARGSRGWKGPTHRHPERLTPAFPLQAPLPLLLAPPRLLGLLVLPALVEVLHHDAHEHVEHEEADDEQEGDEVEQHPGVVVGHRLRGADGAEAGNGAAWGAALCRGSGSPPASRPWLRHPHGLPLASGETPAPALARAGGPPDLAALLTPSTASCPRRSAPRTPRSLTSGLPLPAAAAPLFLLLPLVLPAQGPDPPRTSRLGALSLHGRGIC